MEDASKRRSRSALSVACSLRKVKCVAIDLTHAYHTNRNISVLTHSRPHALALATATALAPQNATKAKMIDYLMKCNKFVDMNIYGLYLTLQARERFSSLIFSSSSVRISEVYLPYLTVNLKSFDMIHKKRAFFSTHVCQSMYAYVIRTPNMNE